jgi:hypothetical protein
MSTEFNCTCCRQVTVVPNVTSICECGRRYETRCCSGCGHTGPGGCDPQTCPILLSRLGEVSMSWCYGCGAMEGEACDPKCGLLTAKVRGAGRCSGCGRGTDRECDSSCPIRYRQLQAAEARGRCPGCHSPGKCFSSCPILKAVTEAAVARARGEKS